MDFGIDIPKEKEFDAIAQGLNAVDHLIVVPSYPKFDTKVEFISHTLSPGGECATAMVALARLGLRTAYVGKVGSDDLGRFQLQWLESQGVDVSAARVVEGAPTQTAFIIIDRSNGERTITWRRDLRLAISAAEVSPEIVTAGRVLLINGPDIDAMITAASFARAKGIPVVIDVETVYPGTERLLQLVDFIISSSAFPGMITGETHLPTALKKLSAVTGSLFVAATVGRRGALAYFQGRFFPSPGFEVACRDTTGAGDAFHGGFIYGLLSGYSVEETMTFANAVAALKCREVGAQTGLPTVDEVRALLAEKGPCR